MQGHRYTGFLIHYIWPILTCTHINMPLAKNVKSTCTWTATSAISVSYCKPSLTTYSARESLVVRWTSMDSVFWFICHVLSALLTYGCSEHTLRDCKSCIHQSAATSSMHANVVHYATLPGFALNFAVSLEFSWFSFYVTTLV